MHLPEHLGAILADWAEGDGRTVDELVEILLLDALRERRRRAQSDLDEARRTLEAVTAMLGTLLRKGPGATLLPADFGDNEVGRTELMQLLGGAEEDDAVADMTMLRAAFDDASDQYRRAERTLLVLDRPAAAATHATEASAGRAERDDFKDGDFEEGDFGESGSKERPPVQVGRAAGALYERVGPPAPARPHDAAPAAPAAVAKGEPAEPAEAAFSAPTPTRFRAARLLTRTTG
ncbi:MAG TPA: hypothetical protein VGD08_07035 [Stellaceae bacterium]|jgi:hypothetical protein